MKRLLLLLVVLVIFNNLYSQDYPRHLDLFSTFNILKDSSTGTCFMIYENQKNYLVTAKHILGNVTNKQKINFSLRQEALWNAYAGKVLLHSNPMIDIAVIVTDFDTLYSNAIKIRSFATVLGQEGYFMGYPFGYANNFTDSGRGNLRVPLIKKCVLSGMFSDNETLGVFLDGHNNPGFSGGPVLFSDLYDKSSSTPSLIAVISGYVNERKEIVTPLGNYKYYENSGIIVSYGAKHITEILRQNGL